MPRKVIGIVGGVGPYAGLEFNKKIFNLTPAKCDQDHLEVILISASSKINDRTLYLISSNQIENPAYGIFEVITRLQVSGADLVAIPCNTAHAPLIWDKLKELLEHDSVKVELLHLLEEMFLYLKKNDRSIHKLGLLATQGTYRSMVYQQLGNQNGFEFLIPSEEEIMEIHSSIYDPSYGIKSKSSPVHPHAKEILEKNSRKLISKGAEAIIMGCTEIPLAMSDTQLEIPLLDPMDITAQRLVELALN